MAKNGNILYQGTLTGYDDPLLTGSPVNNCNDPDFGGVVAINMTDPSHPEKISLLQAPKDVSFGGVATTTLQNGLEVVSAGNVPCYCWGILPDVVTSTLAPKVNGLIQGEGGASWWNVADPTNPVQLPKIKVNRDRKSLKRRELLLGIGSSRVDTLTGKLFNESDVPFIQYVFQSPDDPVIRTYHFTQGNRDYLLLNTISGDMGYAIFDVTSPYSPRKIVEYSPYMNYLLRNKNYCGDIPTTDNEAWSNRYFEDLDPENNPNDQDAVTRLSNKYWDDVNARTFVQSDGVSMSGITNPAVFHTEYIPEKQAFLSSGTSEYYMIDVSNIRRPEIIFNLADREEFPTLTTPAGFDLVQYYRKNGRDIAPGYHNSEVKRLNGELIVSIAIDNYYAYANGSRPINTGFVIIKITEDNRPEALSYIECPGEDCHISHWSTHAEDPLLFTTALESGVKAYNLSDPVRPELLDSASGTFTLDPSIPPIAYPNPKSGFELGSFVNYPEPFRTLSFVTNVPGLPNVVPYQFVPLPFEALVDGDYVYMQARTGATYIYRQVYS